MRRLRSGCRVCLAAGPVCFEHFAAMASNRGWMMRKKVLLLATGGTVVQAAGKDGLTPTYAAADLLRFVPGLEGLCEIHALQMMNVDSTNMQPEYWEDIAKYIQGKYGEYDGFVIVHGTDTMGYTAAALSYMIQHANKPIVLTGSQQPIDRPETDAKRNLTDAVRLACENIGGVYVAFGGKAIRGTRAVKLRTRSRDAFESVNRPAIAEFQGDRVVYADPAAVRPDAGQPPQFYTSLCCDVGLLKLIPGTKTELFDFIADRYQAVVVESYGSGGIPFDRRRDLLSRIKIMVDAGRLVAVTTQCLFEGSDLSLYEVGRKALALPVLPAYDMTTEAAVTKLMWALGQTRDAAEAGRLFLTPVQDDVQPPRP